MREKLVVYVAAIAVVVILFAVVHSVILETARIIDCSLKNVGNASVVCFSTPTATPTATPTPTATATPAK